MFDPHQPDPDLLRLWRLIGGDDATIPDRDAVLQAAEAKLDAITQSTDQFVQTAGEELAVFMGNLEQWYEGKRAHWRKLDEALGLREKQPKRRERKPTVAGVIRQMKRAGVDIAGCEVQRDGTVKVIGGKPSETTADNNDTTTDPKWN